VDAFDISEIVLAVIIVLVMTGIAATLPRPQPVEVSDEPEVETPNPLTLGEQMAARERRERVRKLIGVVEKGLEPPTPEEFAAQLARRKHSLPDGEGIGL
jgi:hypothetical protein